MKEAHRLKIQSHFGEAYVTHALLDLAVRKNRAVTLALIGNDNKTQTRKQLNLLSIGVFEQVALSIRALETESIFVLTGKEVPAALDLILIGLNTIIRPVVRQSEKAILETLQSIWMHAQVLWDYVRPLWGELPNFLADAIKMFSVPFAQILAEYGIYYILPALKTIFYGLKDVVESLIGKIGQAMDLISQVLGSFIKEGVMITVETAGSVLDRSKRAAIHCMFFAASALSEIPGIVSAGAELSVDYLRSQSLGLVQLIEKFILILGEKKENPLQAWFENAIFQPLVKYVGKGLSALWTLIKYCASAVQRIFTVVLSFLPNFCHTLMDMIVRGITSVFTGVQNIYQYITTMGKSSDTFNSDLVFDVKKLLKEAKIVRQNAGPYAHPDDLGQLVRAIGNTEEWLSKLEAHSTSRYKNLIRSGTTGLKELYTDISSSASVLTHLFLKEDDSLLPGFEESLDNIAYKLSGRSMEEFKLEYLNVTVALQSSINLVALSASGRSTPFEKPSAPPAQIVTKRKGKVKEVNGNIFDCFKSREQAQVEIFAMQTEIGNLTTRVDLLKRSDTYQQQEREIRQLHMMALNGARSGEIDAVDSTYRAMYRNINQDVKTMEDRIAQLNVSIAYRTGQLDFCAGLVKPLALILLLGFVGIIAIAWYFQVMRQNEEELRKTAEDKVAILQKAIASNDPCVRQFIRGTYLNKNFAEIAKDDPLLVLEKFRAALVEVPFDLTKNTNGLTDNDLNKWGHLVLQSFHVQLGKTKEDAENAAIAASEEKASLVNKAKAVFIYFYNKLPSLPAADESSPGSDVANARAADAAIAHQWQTTDIAQVNSDLGQISAAYRQRLADFDFNKFANGIEAYGTGEKANGLYRKHLSTLLQMAVSIYDQRLELHYRDIYPKPKNTLQLIWEATKSGASGVYEYGSGWLDTSGIMGANFDKLFDFGYATTQLTRGAPAFVAMQFHTAMTLAWTSYNFMYGAVLMALAIAQYLVGLIFNRHLGLGTAERAQFNEGAAMWAEIGGILGKYTASIAAARILAATTVFGWILSMFLSVFGGLWPAGKWLLSWPVWVYKKLKPDLPPPIAAHTPQAAADSFFNRANQANTATERAIRVQGTFDPSVPNPHNPFYRPSQAKKDN